MLHCLTYISKAAQFMSDAQLLTLLEESRKNNQEFGITGMLLYVRSSLLKHPHGRFVQALEGTETNVHRTFEKIKTDKRHHGITLINRFDIPKRSFNDWTMGFETLSSLTFSEHAKGFKLDQTFLSKNGPDFYEPVLDTLKSFYYLNKTYGS
ncbi:BLUF domain-containing protein [Mucilaginibacter pallidiroseus]|uniref:BLUF domain-containing protein n=1 Tax=Mucilaginibacter pallidiroseus TaxID=2599295 RepID=A0A563UBU5_9SPHI|nr:BLUF domain-containing protein [Mucilaginibacter pallidiroseus]TWR28841.1 BLUF domain-containing protein [Mucilaginibacter pallidiroseus]